MVFLIQLLCKHAKFSAHSVALMAGVPNVQPDEFDYFHFKTIDNGMVAYALLRKQLSRLYMIWARHQIAMLLSLN